MIDGEVGWVSSCNVSDQHLKSVFGEAAWVDAGLRVRGDELRHLTRAFAVAFKGNILQSAFLPRDSLIFINSSYLLRKTLHHDQLRRLRKARERVWLQTPYFVPIPAVYRRLRRLARKGVDVRLMVPAISDVPVVRYMGYAFFKGLLKSGVQIYEYQPRFMHQKITHVDDWITLGSANLNHRSFIHDLEIHVVITKPENQQLMKKKFLEEQEFCKVLTVENLNQRLTWAERALGRVLLLLRYWT